MMKRLRRSLIALSAVAAIGSAAPSDSYGHDHGCLAGKGADEASTSSFFGPDIITSVARPPVVTRTTWNCPDGQSSRWTPQYTTVTHLIVHHSATTNVSANWAATVRSIWNYHALNNGWGDIGYNYLIDPNGVVYEGRAGGDNAIGAHFSCQNGGTMGVCMLGTFTSASPTSAALESLKQLLAWKAEQREIDPLGSSYHAGTRQIMPNISGHRNGNPSTYACTVTSCPGDNLYGQLPEIRNDVAQLIDGAAVPTVLARPATLVTATSARIVGRVTTNGGSAILERRLEWGVSNTWSSFTTNVTVVGNDFYHNLTELTPGTAYQFRAWAQNVIGWHSNGPVFFTTSISQPLNDDFANRTVLSGWSVSTNAGSNAFATAETGEPNHAGMTGGKSVWWSWTAPISARAFVSTAGSSFDTLLGIYAGSSISALTTVASNNDNVSLSSRVGFNCTAGEAYHIAVDGVNGATGNVVLTVLVEPPLNISKANDKVVMSWTNAVTGFALQQSTGLPGAPWVTASPLPIVINGENHLTNALSGAARFYRLRRP